MLYRECLHRSSNLLEEIGHLSPQNRQQWVWAIPFVGHFVQLENAQNSGFWLPLEDLSRLPQRQTGRPIAIFTYSIHRLPLLGKEYELHCGRLDSSREWPD